HDLTCRGSPHLLVRPLREQCTLMVGIVSTSTALSDHEGMFPLEPLVEKRYEVRIASGRKFYT
ncbi:MAG: hypothetical protein ACYTX0_60965, partial [Nostoc sp.]